MSTIYHVNTFDGDYAKEDSLKVKLKSFLKEFYIGNHVYTYRNQLRDHFNLGEYWINVSLEDLDSYDEVLSDKLKKSPSRLMELFEAAATEVCDDITQPRSEGMEIVPNIQVMINSIGIPTPLRYLSSDLVSKLITVSGIVVSASRIHI
uniref:DNA helicase n=1 Tax=Aceria tosichella TaxID=561515 RepID=A0A6G1S4P2_9ACAR